MFNSFRLVGLSYVWEVQAVGIKRQYGVFLNQSLHRNASTAWYSSVENNHKLH